MRMLPAFCLQAVAANTRVTWLTFADRAHVYRPNSTAPVTYESHFARFRFAYDRHQFAPLFARITKHNLASGYILVYELHFLKWPHNLAKCYLSLMYV